jgi:CHAD domain-containing protein
MVNFENSSFISITMKQAHIRDIIDQRVDAIGTHMEKVDGDLDKEVIHEMRVEIKTLRAFMRLLASRDDKRYNLPRKFQRLYDIAGSIRQAQLESDHLLEMDLRLPGYNDALQLLIDKGERQWKKRYKEPIISSLNDKLTEAKYDPLKAKHVEAFVEEQLHAVHEICVMQVVTDDTLHSVRKLIKDILYALKVVKKETNGGSDAINAVPVKKLAHFADMIGDYNDARNMLRHLTEYSCDTDDLSEKQAIQNLLQESTDRLKREKLGIVKQLLQFLNETLISANQTEISVLK